MQTRFWRYFILVAIIHIVLLSGYMFISGCNRIIKRKPVVMMPVEVMMQAPQKTVVAPPVRAPDPVPIAKPKPVAPPKPKKRKLTPVKVSNTRVTRNDKKPPRKVLTDKEIKQRLKNDIKVDTTKYNPTANAVDFAKVKSALYNAWNQPSGEEAGGVVVRAEITFAIDGRITGRRLVKPSGNMVLDQSVMSALKSVHKVNGLSASFLKKHKKVIISFMVD
ncbi:MAG: TonB C-terminal domain-containing protein [Kiritimatiellae bacterium]|nr:TonB C-terminal domain-containing protein [Kiritimatiellia bacterium]